MIRVRFPKLEGQATHSLHSNGLLGPFQSRNRGKIGLLPIVLLALVRLKVTDVHDERLDARWDSLEHLIVDQLRFWGLASERSRRDTDLEEELAKAREVPGETLIVQGVLLTNR